jgi:hypothetical protein
MNAQLDPEIVLGVLGLCCGVPLVVGGIGVILFIFMRNRK